MAPSGPSTHVAISINRGKKRSIESMEEQLTGAELRGNERSDESYAMTALDSVVIGTRMVGAECVS